MIIDDYFAAIERRLQRNVQIGKIEKPIFCQAIATHPHHKHTGPADHLAPADQPTLSQVLAEVQGWPDK